MRKGIIVVCLSFIIAISGTAWAQPTDHLPSLNFGDKELHDVTKDPNQVGDENMCWAATSANILDWGTWGFSSSALALTLEKHDDIYQHFVEKWDDEGGLMKYAWRWWFDGVLPCWLYEGYKEDEEFKCEPCPGEWTTVSRDSGGYLSRPDFLDYYCYYGDFHDDEAMEKIACLLKNGYGVTIAIYDKDAISTDPGHALTVWGYIREDNGKISHLWITDSKPYPVTPLERRLQVEYDLTDMAWYIYDVYGYKDWQIEGVHALRSQDSPPDPGKVLEECGIDCQAETKFAVVWKRCFDSNGEEKMCKGEQSGIIRAWPKGRDRPAVDFERTRFVVPLSSSRNVLKVQIELPSDSDGTLRDWGIGGKANLMPGYKRSDLEIEIDTGGEDFCLRPVIDHSSSP